MKNTLKLVLKNKEGSIIEIDETLITFTKSGYVNKDVSKFMAWAVDNKGEAYMEVIER
jgi:hypothetical protein